MLILGVDTALYACSLALMHDGTVLGRQSIAMTQGHAERLPPMTASLLESCGVDGAAIDRVAVAAGPGQFAGVRIGLAFALGLARGGRAVVLGVSTLEALALSVAGDWSSPRAVVVDAKRGEAYAALYRRPGETLVAPFAAPLAVARDRLLAAHDGGPVVVLGGGAGLLDFPAAWLRVPRDDIDAVALAQFAADADPARYPATPQYLRAPDAAPALPSRFGAAP